MEDGFNIEIVDEVMRKIKTVGDMIKSIEERLQQGDTKCHGQESYNL